MRNDYEFDEADVFEEDAISADEAFHASDRYVATRVEDGLAFQLFEGQEAARLLSRDEVFRFLEQRLEAGDQVLVA